MYGTLCENEKEQKKREKWSIINWETPSFKFSPKKMPKGPITPYFKDSVQKRNTIGELRPPTSIQKGIEVCTQTGPDEFQMFVWMKHTRPDNGKTREWWFKSNGWSWEEFTGLLHERSVRFDDTSRPVPKYVSLHHPGNFRQFDPKVRTGGVYAVPESDKEWVKKVVTINQRPKVTRKRQRDDERQQRLKKLIEERRLLRLKKNIPMWSDDDDEFGAMKPCSLRPQETHLPLKEKESSPSPKEEEEIPQTSYLEPEDIEKMLDTMTITQAALQTISPFVLQLRRISVQCFFWTTRIEREPVGSLAESDYELGRLFEEMKDPNFLNRYFSEVDLRGGGSESELPIGSASENEWESSEEKKEWESETPSENEQKDSASLKSGVSPWLTECFYLAQDLCQV